MRNFVITIPIDENLEACAYEIGYRLYCKTPQIVGALEANDPDKLFEIFDGMEDRDLGIEYSFGLEITADEPVAGQRVGDRVEIPHLEVMG